MATPPDDPSNKPDDEKPAGETSELVQDGEIVEGEPVDDIPDRQRRVFAAQSFSGPLPPPETLGAYNDVLPGLAREIIDQWKGETAHRHMTIDELRTTDREALRLFHEAEKRGQRYALTAITLLLVVVVISVVLDRPAVGVAGIIAGAAALVWALRRRSDIPDHLPVEPKDLADGDQLETPPDD